MSSDIVPAARYCSNSSKKSLTPEPVYYLSLTLSDLNNIYLFQFLLIAKHLFECVWLFFILVIFQRLRKNKNNL